MRKGYLHPVSSYDELWSQVDFTTMDIPTTFNLGVACLDDQDPDARALVVVHADKTSTTYTFGEVLEASNRLANVLTGIGVERGDVVAIVKRSSFETAAAFMAIFRMGAIALPLSSLFGPDALSYRLEHSGAKAVITSQENAPKVRDALAGTQDVAVFVTGEAEFNDTLAAASAEFEPVETGSDDPAFLIYTSGTTGNPKGALHAHRIVFGHISCFEAIYEFFPKPEDVLWSPADWAWIAGLMDILVPAWYFGLPVVVDDDSAGFTAERAVWLMREFSVTLSLLPPTALRIIRSAGLQGGGFSLRAIGAGGEVFGADLLAWCAEFFGCAVNEGYGQTEMNGPVGNCSSVYEPRLGSLGKALPGVTVAVLNDAGDPVINETGRIAIDRRHPSTLLRYWDDPEATKRKFLGNWLLTGDLGSQDEDGYLWFVSRDDDVIKSSGYRIGPGEIEGTLGSHKAVSMAAVVGIPDERRGQVPKAFVVLREGAEPSEELAEELRAHVRKNLAPHEVPRQIVFRDELPTTTTGKVIRRALRDA